MVVVDPQDRHLSSITGYKNIIFIFIHISSAIELRIKYRCCIKKIIFLE